MKKQKKQLYEGMFIVSAQLSEEARKKALSRITDKINNFEGKIESIIEMGRKKLGYEIGLHKEGYYFLVYFECATNTLFELHKEFRLNEDLIRFMIEKTQEAKTHLEFKKFIEVEG
jgi:small subunit ribosomal protein S6